ncbi:peptidase MA family metallohydrolase [Kribbella sp. NPDC051587]|uniref:peptidase MA family metallohydrolase n=1 Tax=Kribbella sp. NPDC051587 TaxID=3364119 RepID=UPI0037A29F08
MKHPRRLVAAVTTLAIAGAVAVVGVRLQQGAAAPGSSAAAIKATPSSQLTAEQTAQRKQEINKLLSARATAVRKGDLKAFLAAVNTKDAKLAARQRTLFANLRQFGFTRLEYFLANEHQVPRLTEKYGPTAFSSRVMMRYQLTGLDAKPVQTDVAYTFVRRGTGWLLVEDNAIDEVLSRDGHRQPWDFQPITVVRRGKVSVVVAQREAALGQKIAATAQQSVSGVRRHWPQPWDGSVMVVAMPEPQVMAIFWTNGFGRGWTIAAKDVPLFDGDPVGRTPARAAGSRIVVNPEQRKKLDKDLLAHEMTHAASVLLGNEAPMWMVEGYAEYVRCAVIEDDPGWTVDPYRKNVRKTLASMKALPGPTEFATNGDRSYGQSWWVIEYLVDRFGVQKVAALYADLAAHATGADAIVKKHTKMTPAQLLAAVKKFRG